MRDSEYNCAVASSEYNEALRAREYTPAWEYGATEERRGERKKKRSSARQRALMQATAAVMTAVVAVSAAALPTAPAETGTPYPEEYRYILDHIIDLCSEGDRDAILAYISQEPLMLEAGQAFMDCYRTEVERDKDGSGRCYYNGSLVTRSTGDEAILYLISETYEDAPISVYLEYFQAGNDRFSGTNGYCLSYELYSDETHCYSFTGIRKELKESENTISLSGRYEETEPMRRVSMEGEFVSVYNDAVVKILSNTSAYDDGQTPITFLENGMLNYYFVEDHGSAEIRDGFLIPTDRLQLSNDYSGFREEEAQELIDRGLLMIGDMFTPDRGGLQQSLYHTSLQWMTLD